MKKLTAILTTIVMLMSIVGQSAVFAAFSDVDDTNQYKKAITSLTKLSVIDGYEDGTFKPEGQITRAEFTKLIVFILGYQDLTYDNSEFTDVATTHWAKNYIQTAYSLGIIAGMGDGTFAPDSPVTYEQALKMIVCTLGYTTFAESLGEYPQGYIQQASNLLLTKNISTTQYSDGASRGIIAQALYNALEVEMYENNGFTWEQTTKTLMNDYLKVKKLKGTLIGVEDYVTEACTNDLLEDQMAILTNDGEEITMDFSTYTQTAADISKYLQHSITVYYRQLTENDERTLIIIDDESTKNSQYDINYDDISSLSNTTFKYYDANGSTKTLKMKDSDSLTVRYNGDIVSSNDTVTLVNPTTKEENSYTRQEALELWLNPNTDYSIYGNAVLTDNGSDNSIDMIQIYDYDVIVAYAAPNTSDYRITDKLVTGNFIVLNPQAADYTYTITKNGAEIPVTSISANDVILYAKSLDGSRYTLNVSNKTVKGSITSINTSNNQMTISGNAYNIGEKCASYISEKDNKELKAGVSGTFYLDALGTAVFGTLEKSTVIPYAYIINAVIANDEGGKGYMTIYAPSVSASSASSYPMKTKIKLNGSSQSTSSVINALGEAAGYTNDDVDYADKIYGAGHEPNLTGYSQPARVTIKDGEITEIVILTSDELQAQNEDTDQVIKCKEIANYTYSSNNFTLDGKNAFSVNSSTVVLCVPGDRTQSTKYAKKTPSSAFTSGESYYVEAYDISESKIAKLVILYGNNTTLTPIKKDTNFSVVSTLPESIYSDINNDTVLKFDVFAGSNTAKSWTTYDDSEFSDVQVGDVVQFAYDSDQLAQGRVNNIKFADIASVLDGAIYNDQKFNWEEEQDPTEENNYQSYKFDYRFKKSGTDDDEMYTSSSLGTIPYSTACMYNVSQVLLEDKKLYVTKGGFYTDEEGNEKIDDEDYEEVTIASSTKIVRMEEERDEISRYAVNTTTDLSISDFKDAKNYGTDCSKILVCSSKGVAKLIVIYN